MSVILGLLVSIGLILLSAVISGDQISALISGPAAMIVLGGVFGAVLTQYGFGTMLGAVRALGTLVKPPKTDLPLFINHVADWSNLARSQGSLSLEAVLGSTNDRFQKKGLQMIIDNTSQDDLRSIFGILSDNVYRAEMLAAEVFEAAGGYAPTIGVLGAVLGLIHVMTRLDHPSELGVGIATAFTATVYGVGSANLIFLPLHARLANFAESRDREREVVIQGFVLLSDGKSGTLIRQNLQSFIPEKKQGSSGGAGVGDGPMGATAGQAA
ncbi:MAG: flagellar motor protein [Proteobacteria bacterium]|nr:flagellar motor protein [Pseudomonadota bacterium]